MIFVSISVPVLDRVYDFELEEDVLVSELKDKIVSLIAWQEQVNVQHADELLLYGMRMEKILNEKLTLCGQGVRTGDELVLL